MSVVTGCEPFRPRRNYVPLQFDHLRSASITVGDNNVVNYVTDLFKNANETLSFSTEPTYFAISVRDLVDAELPQMYSHGPGPSSFVANRVPPSCTVILPNLTGLSFFLYYYYFFFPSISNIYYRARLCYIQGRTDRVCRWLYPPTPS